jgi:hypothetical protein
VSISAVTALASVFLAGCDDPDDGSDRYCLDRTTSSQVDDQRCESDHTGTRYGWQTGRGRSGGGTVKPPARGGFGGHGTSGGG